MDLGEAGDHFRSLILDAVEDESSVSFTEKGVPLATAIAAAKLDAMQRTLALLSDPDLVDKVVTGLEAPKTPGAQALIAILANRGIAMGLEIPLVPATYDDRKRDLARAAQIRAAATLLSRINQAAEREPQHSGDPAGEARRSSKSGGLFDYWGAAERAASAPSVMFQPRSKDPDATREAGVPPAPWSDRPEPLPLWARPTERTMLPVWPPKKPEATTSPPFPQESPRIAGRASVPRDSSRPTPREPAPEPAQWTQPRSPDTEAQGSVPGESGALRSSVHQDLSKALGAAELMPSTPEIVALRESIREALRQAAPANADEAESVPSRQERRNRWNRFWRRLLRRQPEDDVTETSMTSSGENTFLGGSDDVRPWPPAQASREVPPRTPRPAFAARPRRKAVERGEPVTGTDWMYGREDPDSVAPQQPARLPRSERERVDRFTAADEESAQRQALEQGRRGRGNDDRNS